MAEPIPPLPNVPPPPDDAPWYDQLMYWSAATRHADSLAVIAATTQQTAASGLQTTAIVRATDLQEATYQPTDEDRWWDLAAGIAKNADGNMLFGLGMGEVAKLADKLLTEFRKPERFPLPPPA